ncbi:MAG: mannosyltransferase family protein [Acidimicrobiales bacterium]|nr:mannosyltransferase family protein [Acidimicrobiales bacterium]
MRAWRRDLLASLAAWTEARIYVAVAYLTTWAIIDRLEPPPAFSPIDDGLIPWDGTWYRDLAANGYDDPGLGGGIRFFPLWPLLGRFFGWIGDRPDIALVVLANLLALVAGTLLYRLTVQETNDHTLARRTVRLFSLFPPAFVLILGYSEALYLSLAIGMVLSARARKWTTTAALGFLAGLTRPVAGLLAFPTLVNGWRHRRSPTTWLAVASAPLGTLTFLIWSERNHDGWRAPIDAQRDLRGEITEPISRLVRGLGDGLRGDEGELFHTAAAIVIIGLAVVVVRRLRTDLAVYTALSTLLLVSADNLNSMERYALSVFPLIIAAGMVSRHPLLDRWLPAASAVGLTAITTLALNGVYVP